MGVASLVVAPPSPKGWCRSGDVVLISRGHDDVHPNTHGLGAGCHHVEKAFIGFDAESQARVGALGDEEGWRGLREHACWKPSLYRLCGMGRVI